MAEQDFIKAGFSVVGTENNENKLLSLFLMMDLRTLHRKLKDLSFPKIAGFLVLAKKRQFLYQLKT